MQSVLPNINPKLIPTSDELWFELNYNYLDKFIRTFWRYVETSPYVSGWHIDAICDHLQAVTFGLIRKLIINIPPRHMKSLGVSVFWPAWEWLRIPQTRWLFSSYAQDLSTRDSVKCRRVIESPLYKKAMEFAIARSHARCAMNGDPVPNHTSFTLVGDQNTKTRYENNFGGQRLATSVGGMLTGEGGDKIVVDDPHNVTEVESTVARKSTLSWWDESMSTRANDPMKSVYVIIMQRTHESDLTGHVLSREQGWDHLCLPAEFESNTKYYYDKNRRITDPFKTVSTLGFVDPRMEDGEPLWGKRWTKEAISQLKETLGAYASAGQLQQRPAPREGGMFNVDNFILMENYNMGHVEKYVRYWDKAGTQGGGAYTAGCLMAKLKKGCSPQYVIVDMVHGQWSSAIREQKIKQTADLDTRKVEVWVEQEPGSGGKESSENTIKMLAGFKAYAERVTGSKETRAEPYSSQVEIGNVGILIRPWTKNLLDEHQIFPNGKYKDQVDAAGGAFNKLAAVKKTGGVW